MFEKYCCASSVSIKDVCGRIRDFMYEVLKTIYNLCFYGYDANIIERN